MTSNHHRRSALATARRKSPPLVVIGLQYSSLEKLLCETLCEYCENESLRDSARHQFHGMALRQRQSGEKLSNDELDYIVSMLGEMLDESPLLPPHMVARVHTHVGLVHHLRKEYECAVESFTKALWLETSISSSNGLETDKDTRVEIGLCLHRLGISYHKNGDNDKAFSSLGKALQVYETLGFTKDENFVVHAREERDAVRNELVKQKRPWQSTPHINPLPTIMENGARRHTFNFEKAASAPRVRMTSV